MDKEEYGRRLMEGRKKAGLTRDDVVKKAPVSLSALSAYERGEKVPPMEVAVRIADVLGVSLDWLASRGTTEEPLQTMKDAINSVAVLTADYPDISIKNEVEATGYFYKSIITLRQFSREASIMIEKLLPLMRIGSITRDQYLLLLADAAKRNNYPLNPAEEDQ